MEQHHTPGAPCPYCGALLDGASNVNGPGAPSPGDWSLCIYCAGLLVFDDGLLQVEPDESQLAEMLANRDVRRAQQTIKQMHADPSWEAPP